MNSRKRVCVALPSAPVPSAAPRWVAAGATTINVVMSLFCWRMDRAQGWFDDLAQSWEYLALR